MEPVEIIFASPFGGGQVIELRNGFSQGEGQGVEDRALAHAVGRGNRANRVRLEFQDERRALVVDAAKALDLELFKKPADLRRRGRTR
ncbi:hypothetical protein D3C71_1150000 [compost metagenome]